MSKESVLNKQTTKGAIQSGSKPLRLTREKEFMIGISTELQEELGDNYLRNVVGGAQKRYEQVRARSDRGRQHVRLPGWDHKARGRLLALRGCHLWELSAKRPVEPWGHFWRARTSIRREDRKRTNWKPAAQAGFADCVQDTLTAASLLTSRTHTASLGAHSNLDTHREGACVSATAPGRP